MRFFNSLCLIAISVVIYSCGIFSKGSAESDKAETATECSEADGHNHNSQEAHNHEGEEAHNHEGHDHEGHQEPNHEGGVDEHNHAAEAGCTEVVGAISLSGSQAKELGLEYKTVQRAPFSGAIRTWGVVEPAPGDAAQIVATLSGVVNLAQGKGLTIGSYVKKGQKLLVINTSELSQGNVTQELANARATLVRAEAEFKRIEALRKGDVSTQSQYQEALLNKQIALNAVRALSHNTNATGQRTILSPMTGYITSLEAIQGSYVEQGALMMTISASKKMVVRADVPQRHTSLLSQIHTLNFTLPALGAKVFSTDDLVSTAREAKGGIVGVRFAIDNQASILPGSSVEAYLQTSPRAGVISIPLTALTDEQGQKYGYIFLGKDTYLKRHLTLGESNGMDIEVLSGINEGDNVVTKGAYFVRLASMSGAIPHGHSH